MWPSSSIAGAPRVFKLEILVSCEDICISSAYVLGCTELLGVLTYMCLNHMFYYYVLSISIIISCYCGTTYRVCYTDGRLVIP